MKRNIQIKRAIEPDTDFNLVCVAYEQAYLHVRVSRHFLQNAQLSQLAGYSPRDRPSNSACPGTCRAWTSRSSRFLLKGFDTDDL